MCAESSAENGKLGERARRLVPHSLLKQETHLPNPDHHFKSKMLMGLCNPGLCSLGVYNRVDVTELCTACLTIDRLVN